LGIFKYFGVVDMNMKKSAVVIIGILVLLGLFVLGCRSEPQKYMVSKEEQQQEELKEQTGVANPATLYCMNTTGAAWSVKEDDDGGQYGVCTFSDSSWCEEWAYYRGQCKPGLNVTLCEGQFWGKSTCPPDYNPVCGKILVGEEEPYQVKWEDFSNACKACISSTKT
jgi:putative hemolysin